MSGTGGNGSGTPAALATPGPTVTPPVLRVQGLRAGYGDIEVLHGVDLEVAPGELVVLLGANGAGKSTLLRTLAGRISPRAGTVELGGRSAPSKAYARARAGLSYVGEDRHVTKGLTVWQSAKLAADPSAVLEQFPQLPELARRRCELLSGGEQQMLALARAMARGPKVLMVDELSLGLAPLVRDHLLARVRRACDEGLGALVVEQAIGAALGVADRTYVLRRGVVVASEPAERWRADPDGIVELFFN